MGRDGAQQRRIAIRRRLDDALPAQGTAAATDILHNHALAEDRAHPLGHDPGEHVDRPAGGGRDHHADRAARIVLLPKRRTRQQRSRAAMPMSQRFAIIVLHFFSTILFRRVEARQKPVQRGAMRPSLLDPLFAALTTLPGVGPKLEKLYRRLFGREDTPARVDRSAVPPADRHHRPARAAEAPRRGAGLGRDRRGHRRQPPAAAAEPAAPALSHRNL